MKKTRKAIETPLEPLSDMPEEEPRSVRLKRYFWFLGIALVLIGLLAWGLMSSKPAPTSPETLSQGENSPDAVIEKLHLVSTVRGQKRWEFWADVARLYQNQKQAYSDNITAYYYKKDKLASVLTADHAIVNTETNATEAEGHVELVVENGSDVGRRSKLETEKLNWDPDTDMIKTDGWVRVYKGRDEITAMGMVADTQLNNIRFTKDVQTKVRDTHELENFSNPQIH
ncbi:MAG TPA: LPS export ABC transporter periplasmic protein LptC [bacterium]|nr:LPS export ABC transporter periplasmic protein LptC [bacterium]